ncbi:outer mitochondrial transmembrane helix translocase-like [Lineus longissimus]|uniref:outer mitochondrial transmembrane helix translocase-like n=1 Tax=Lineus longissimus TaxID=88925 RepID=UPI002B4C7B8B
MMDRPEIVARAVSTLVGLTVSFAITYCGVKWLGDAMDPTRKEKKESHQRAEKLLKSIGCSNIKLTDYELCIASNLVDPLNMVISWEDIGGLDETVQEILETVIMPFKRREIFGNSTLMQAPKGVLLYGPPGCGKTMIAKATAKAAGARFINLQVSSLVDKWYGESQKRAEAVFSLAYKLQPTIIFIDEIDSFLRSRNSSDHESTAMIKTQFMSFWDGLMTNSNSQIMIIGATNRPQDVDAAILRRMPSMFHIGLPNKRQRNEILKLILKDENCDESVTLSRVSDDTEKFSGSDLRELCRHASIYRVREFMKEEDENSGKEGCDTSNSLRSLGMNDFHRALRKMKESRLLASRMSRSLELD